MPGFFKRLFMTKAQKAAAEAESQHAAAAEAARQKADETARRQSAFQQAAVTARRQALEASAARQPVDKTTLEKTRQKCWNTIHDKWVYTFKPTDPDVLRCLNERAVTSSEEITVFRGKNEVSIPQEKRLPQKIERGWWFATTTNIMAALFHAHRGYALKYEDKYRINRTGPLTNENLPRNMCCLYMIHVQPGIPYVDINSILGDRHVFAYEYEIVVSTEGSFFQDSAMTVPGFRKLTPEDKLTGIFQNRIAENMKKNTFEFDWLYNPVQGRRRKNQLKYSQENLNASVNPQIMKLLMSPTFDIFEAWYGIPEVGSAGALANDAITAAEARAAAAAAVTAMAELEEINAVYKPIYTAEEAAQREFNIRRVALENAKQTGTTEEIELADTALKTALAVYNEARKKSLDMYHLVLYAESKADKLVKAAEAAAAVAAITAERVPQGQGASASAAAAAAAGGGGGYSGGARRNRKTRRGRSSKVGYKRSHKTRSRYTTA